MDYFDKINEYMRTHSHRLNHLPLCQSDCDTWWDACQNELTCTDNWYAGFSWEDGYDGQFHNMCKGKGDAQCKPINSWFKSSTHFCEVRPKSCDI
jgi:folate receptor